MDYIWNVTGRCNLNCKYCWDIFKQEKEMDTRKAKEMIDRISSDKCEMLLFTGGEPLVRNDLFELISYADSKKISNIKICTNGVLIDKYIQKIVTSAITEIHISLDSLVENDKQYRGYRIEKILQNINLLKSKARNNQKIVLVTVVDIHNMQNFEDVLKYASEKGMLVSYQLPIKTENSDLNLFVDGMCRDEIELLFVKLNEFHKKYRETMDYFARFYYLTAKRYFLNNVIPTQCGAGTDFSIISPNGDIYSCYSHKDKLKDCSQCFNPKCLIWFRSGERARKIIYLVH